MRATSTLVGNTINAGSDLTLIINSTASDSQTSASTIKELHQILRPVDTAAYDSYVSKVEECFEGTRVKVLEEIWEWVNSRGNQASIYVLDGVAGIGKSTVAQTIAYKAAKEEILGASFFFSSEGQERQTTQHFVPTIAYHFAKHRKKFAQHLVAALNKHPDIAQKNLREQLTILILQPLQKSLDLNPVQRLLLPAKTRPTLLVLDALDECDAHEAKVLLEHIAEDFQAVFRFKVFITTRPEFHLRQVLDQHKHHERFRLHEIEDSIVQADIRLYLEFRLSNHEIQKQLPGIGTLWQPDAQQMSMLCGICGNLFIIASTAVKFILDERRADPKHQLSHLLNGVSPEKFSGSPLTDVMDEIYLHVLSALFKNHDSDTWVSRYQTVIGACVTLQCPLPCQSLAELLDVNCDYIDQALIRLHSLIAPKGPDRIYRIHHKTFPDFITDEARIRKACRGLTEDIENASIEFLINTRSNHLKLAKQCFRIMMAQLRPNLCDLRGHDLYKDNQDVKHLLRLNPSSALAYACTHWAHHVNILSKSGGVDDELKQCIQVWQAPQLLNWLEALSVLGKIDSADYILETGSTSIENFSGSWPEAGGILEMLEDGRVLVAENIDTLKLSSMHVYWSLLPFLSVSTRVFQEYGRVDGVFGTDRSWSRLVAEIRAHSGPVTSVTFSDDGSRLASASDDKTVRLCDGKTGAQIATLRGHLHQVYSVAFSGDGSRLASGSFDCTVQVWNGKTGDHIITLMGHSSFVLSVALSSDGSRLASASYDTTVRLWDGQTGARIATLKDPFAAISCVAFSSDGSTLASTSCNKVRLWDGKTGARVTTLKGHSDLVGSVAFSSDGSVLASASDDRTIRLWNGHSGVHISTFAHGLISKITTVAFPSGHTTQKRRLFALMKRRKPSLWCLVALTENPDKRWNYIPFLWFPPHLDPSTFAVNSTGTSIAVGCDDGRVLLFDISTVVFT